jgi:hypothetical protein
MSNDYGVEFGGFSTRRFIPDTNSALVKFATELPLPFISSYPLYMPCPFYPLQIHFQQYSVAYMY